MKTIKVAWEVTEEHEITVEVDDDFDPEEIDSDWLAESETGDSYCATTERGILWHVEMDTKSSASRQHFIDTGEYLPPGEAESA